MADRPTYDELESRLRTLEEAERALRESEGRYRTIVENAREWIWQTDRDGRFLFLNRHAETISGKTREEWHGQPHTLFVHPLEVEHVDRVHEAVLAGEVVKYETAISDADGELIRLEVLALPIDEDGVVTRTISFGRDVTDRRQVDLEKEVRSEILRAFLADSDQDMFDDVLRTVLRAFESEFGVVGYVREDGDLVCPSMTNHVWDECRMKDKAIVFPADTLEGSIWGNGLLTGRSNYSNEPFGVPEGHVPIESCLTAPLVLGGRSIGLLTVANKPGGYYEADRQFLDSIARTVAPILHSRLARRRAEGEKLALERQVLHAQKLESLGVLAGGIAHDFNNILMAILGNAELALDAIHPLGQGRRNVEEISEAAKRAADLARLMLAYSGKGRFVIEPIDLNAFVEEMPQLLEASITKKATLEYDLAPDLPSLEGDAAQIRQVILNLIINASESLAGDSGTIRIATGARRCDRAYLDDVEEILRAGQEKPLAEGAYVFLEVADTGAGMDRDTVARIFDPFFTTKFTGRGLGLSALLGIVRGHHGAIKVDSEPGRGTTFRVLFPALATEADAAGEGDPAAESAPPVRGTLILAEDEAAVRKVGALMLERLGFRVMAAEDGREALRLFREHADEIDGVILDLTMPRLDGEEAFREMRRIRHDVKVILCSGYHELEATARFADLDLAGFLQKPFTLADLKARLADI